MTQPRNGPRKANSDGDGGLPIPVPVEIANTAPVALQRTEVPQTPDQQLWNAIKDRTEAIRFNRYSRFIETVLCSDVAHVTGGQGHLRFKDPDTEGAFRDAFAGHYVDRVRGYDVLKLATEMFLMMEAGIALRAPGSTGDDDLQTWRDDHGFNGDDADPEGLGPDADFDLGKLRTDYLGQLQDSFLGLPYVEQIIDRLRDVPRKDLQLVQGSGCYGILRDQVNRPVMIELIWSFWMEQGMLHQALQALALRFQNKLVPGHEPLSHFEIDPLRGVSNLLWGYIQDEGGRLSVQRRAYEYLHEYGLLLTGRAVPRLTPADNRPEFLRAFHDLLATALAFYQTDDDTTVQTDGFPVTNALRNLHMILAEGAHNQYGDLPWTARVEMLVQQWILARPEMLLFLHGRIMVPYAERWMDRVDQMRQTLGWGSTSIMHFRDLAIRGERLLLSVRWGAWSVNHSPASGANWARAWREDVQTYAHAYNAVTGVDLGLPASTVEARGDRYVQPAVYLEQALPAGVDAGRQALPQGGSRVALGRGRAGRPTSSA